MRPFATALCCYNLAGLLFLVCCSAFYTGSCVKKLESTSGAWTQRQGHFQATSVLWDDPLEYLVRPENATLPNAATPLPLFFVREPMLPGQRKGANIIEPRYKNLIDQHSEIGLVLNSTLPGEVGVCAAGVRVRIILREERYKGTNATRIVMEGVERFKLLALAQRRSSSSAVAYPMGLVELKNGTTGNGTEVAKRVKQLVANVIAMRNRLYGPPPSWKVNELWQFEEPEDLALCWRVARLLPLDARCRQLMLQENSCEKRLEALEISLLGLERRYARNLGVESSTVTRPTGAAGPLRSLSRYIAGAPLVLKTLKRPRSGYQRAASGIGGSFVADAFDANVAATVHIEVPQQRPALETDERGSADTTVSSGSAGGVSVRHLSSPEGATAGNTGTGFIVGSCAERLLIVTNSHVCGRWGDDAVSVSLLDGRTLFGKVLKRWQNTDSEDWSFEKDFALIEVALPPPSVEHTDSSEYEKLPCVRLGDSDKVRVGDFLIVVGNPRDLRNVATFGIASSILRPTAFESGGEGVVPNELLLDRGATLIATDALYNKGISGGPLLNARGEVVGVNTFVQSIHSGLGFAVAINRVRETIEAFLEEQEDEELLELFLSAQGR